MLIHGNITLLNAQCIDCQLDPIWQLSLDLHHPQINWSNFDHRRHLAESIGHWSVGKAWI